MTPIQLTLPDLAGAAFLVAVEAGLSLLLGLGSPRHMLVAAGRMVVQLLLVGVVLRAVFALGFPARILSVVVIMTLVAVREVAARPAQRL